MRRARGTVPARRGRGVLGTTARGDSDLDRLDIAASYRTHPYDGITRAELLASRTGPTPASTRYRPPPCSTHRPTPIVYPAGTVYVCACGWRDARALPDVADVAVLTA